MDGFDYALPPEPPSETAPWPDKERYDKARQVLEAYVMLGTLCLPAWECYHHASNPLPRLDYKGASV